jgi:outer membrane protein TolC
MFYLDRLPAALPIVLALLPACAMQSYRAAPIDAAVSAQRFEERRVDTPQLREYMQAHGHASADWPLQRWGLSELTLLAFYDHPELDFARAQARAVRAEALAATQRLPLGIVPRIEHHSLREPEQSSPWSLGFEVQVPLGGTATRTAIRSRYDALAQAADLKVGQTAWELRGRLRQRLLDLYANQQEAELLEREQRERETMQKLLEQRLQAGAASMVEVNNARLSLVDVQSRLQAARAARARHVGALAEALSLPIAVVRSLQLDYAELTQPISAQDDRVRSAALLNRLDVRSQLLEYAAAEADVQLEVARQYPTLAITPGFLWDQGDQVWSLAAALVPAVAGNRPAIGAAEARRALQASRFRELQHRVIAQAQAAFAAYAQLVQALAQADAGNALHAAREHQVERQFESGYADRVELTAAHLQAIEAQRGTFALRLETLRAQGALEDMLQVPLGGGPLPIFTGGRPDDTAGLSRQ